MSAKVLMAKDLKDLGGFFPSRLPLEWDLSGHGLTDKFFADHYAAFVSNVKLHVDDMFRVGGLPLQGSVWAISTERKNRDLEHIIRAIARPNPSDPNSWDELMVCNEKRMAVMRAVFVKIYSEQLFSMQLFGADDTQRRTLVRQDEEFIGHEGFRRSKLRATTVRMILAETHGLPPLFWAQVDQFACRVFKLLHPVLTWVRMTWPENGTNPSIRSIFQMIHKDTAYAAWLAVNVRMSPTILNFDWKLPGERYLPKQVEVYPEVYTRHRREVTERESSEGSRYGMAHPGCNNPNPPARTARVMISVVPLVQRISIVGGDNGEEPLGFQKATLIAPRVVYYHGLDNDQDDAAQFKEGPPRCSTRSFLVRAVCVYSGFCMVILVIGSLIRLPYSENFWNLLN
ncbi:uncharacterized protein LY79DRAFT_667809 [Colletotrichum navitas]|uniref:Uncharacterized protein n=1 Tax=Colletotrichum navitas TaxID=681940 RepID=A0AAD8Q5Y3_9PEZI|nr:uncharacterized protein LY79DRAFT_667809 [Colletotrichum navitas]KAK1595858.1 hypothetical protein LY79DRAFT_667809 [Colletotrichum navitas]